MSEIILARGILEEHIRMQSDLLRNLRDILGMRYNESIVEKVKSLVDAQKEANTPNEDAWNNFIAHLNKVQPLKNGKKTIEHQSFIGSISSYEQIFREANAHLQERI
jgi:hypothetical protein